MYLQQDGKSLTRARQRPALVMVRSGSCREVMGRVAGRCHQGRAAARPGDGSLGQLQGGGRKSSWPLPPVASSGPHW
jgi:hypothetical protein